MIDDKELEARLTKFVNDNMSVLPSGATISPAVISIYSDIIEYCKVAYRAGARSQDEPSYQRGRREVLEELHRKIEVGDNMIDNKGRQGVPLQHLREIISQFEVKE